MADKVEVDLIVEAISKGFDKIHADLEALADKSKQGEQGTKFLGMSLDKLKAAAMGAAVVVSGALVAGLVKSVMAASDAEEAMSKFNIVFKDIEGGPAAFAAEVDAMAAATGRSKNELYGMVAGLGDLFQPLGFGVEAAGDLSLQMTQLAIDLSSFNNMSMDEALTRLQGTLIGSHENALAFGVVINENTLKAELAANGWDKLTGSQLEQAKVQARLNLLMAGTTAAQGDAERTADGFANQTRALQASMQDLAVEIGQEFLPVATDLIAMLRDFAGNAAPAAVAAAKFLASGLRVATDIATGYKTELRDMLIANEAQIRSQEMLTDELLRVSSAYKQSANLAGMVTGTTKVLKQQFADLAGRLVDTSDNFEDYRDRADKVEEALKGVYGETVKVIGNNVILNGKLITTVDKVYEAGQAWQAYEADTSVASSVTEYMTTALKDDTVAIDDNTESLQDNVEIKIEAAQVNEDLADKAAQVAAQETAIDPAVRAANLALEQQIEAEILAVEQAEALRVKTEELQAVMAGNFAEALSTTNQGTMDWTQELFNQATQLGLTAAEMVLLAEATGNYTAEQIEAALKTALMQEEVVRLATAVANGEMSVHDAVASLDSFQSAIDSNVGATQRFIDKLNSIPRTIDVYINTHGGTTGGTPYGAGGYQPLAEGGLLTGGIPGRDSIPIMGMPGERMLTVEQNKNFEQLIKTLAQQKGGNTMNMYVTANDGGANANREYNYMRAVMGV